MLVVRCMACKTKLWKYDKIGPKVQCPCGREVGIDKGSFYKMIAKAVTYSGTKRNG